MFDFAWSEIALIGVVALVLIGPKDLPVAVKAVSDVVKKMRRMAGEFQSQVDEMVKDTSLAEVRQQINEIRNFDVKSQIEKTIDADGSLRSTFASNPLEPTAATVVSDDLPKVEDVAAGEPAAVAITPPEPEVPFTPAFIPPNLVPRPEPVQAVADNEPPAFIPPEVVRQRQPRPPA